MAAAVLALTRAATGAKAMTMSNSAMRSTGKMMRLPKMKAIVLGLDTTANATKPVAPSPRLMKK
jgi:hypothetical protein